MMALLSIILFVATDIYDETNEYSNDEKTDMILMYGECNKIASAVVRLQIIIIFLKTLRFDNFILPNE
jgi:hypothetical protein